MALDKETRRKSTSSSRTTSDTTVKKKKKRPVSADGAPSRSSSAKRSSSKSSSAGSSSAPRRRRRNSKKARRQRQIRMAIMIAAVVICLAVLIFSIVKIAGILFGYNSGSKEYKKLQQDNIVSDVLDPESDDFKELTDSYMEAVEAGQEEPSIQRMSRIDYDSLKAINPDCLGWIEIPGTMISYPLVQGTDDSYYLSHTFSGETNKSGSIFVEAANKPDFSDLHTLIYGHNMKNGSMFADLNNYKKESYFKKHPLIYVDLGDRNHCYQIFSAYEAAADDNVYSVGYVANDTYAAFLDGLVASSMYSTGTEVSISDKVITLSTCTSKGNKRFVVSAKKLY